MFLAYNVLWEVVKFHLNSYENTMNDVYVLVIDLQEVEYVMLLLGGATWSWQ